MKNDKAKVFVREDGTLHTVPVISGLSPELSAQLRVKWQGALNLLVRLLGVSTGLVMEIEHHDMRVFLSSDNPENPYRVGESCPLESGLYCENVIGSDRNLLVEDSRRNPLWHGNIDEDLGMNSYYGRPLHWKDGAFFGTLCVLNEKPLLDEADMKALLQECGAAMEKDLEILMLMQDLETRAKRAEELRAQAETSEARIQALLAEAHRSEKAKSDFFSKVSHDMRTPLTSIIGLSDLLAREEDPAVMKRCNEKIRLSSQLLLELINDTLTLSKCENGKLVLHEDSVYARKLFDSIAVPIGELARSKGVSFEASGEQLADIAIIADSLSLRKIALNLLSNAVKFTPAGGHVSYSVTLTPREDGTYESTSIVRDDGIGMTKAFQAHMFEPFEQEERADSACPGTGLGLAIVKQLTDLMGGTITVDSAENAGTTFTVRMILKKADRPPADPQAPSQDLLQSGSLQGKRILMVEDNALNRQIITALLQQEGLLVDSAENGRLGVARFRDRPVDHYDLILMDLRMPVMDGLAATRAIRALARPDAQTIPIVAMTADAFPEAIQKSLAAGMNGHIAKPIDVKEVFSLLRALIA